MHIDEDWHLLYPGCLNGHRISIFLVHNLARCWSVSEGNCYGTLGNKRYSHRGGSEERWKKQYSPDDPRSIVTFCRVEFIMWRVFFCLPAQTRSIKAVCIITLSIQARQRMPALLSLNNITSEYSTALAWSLTQSDGFHFLLLVNTAPVKHSYALYCSITAIFKCTAKLKNKV